MHLTYRGFTHGIGLAGAAIQTTAIENDAREIISHLHRWDVEGMLVGSSESDMDAKLTALMNAYAVNGGDLALVLSTGANSVTSVRSRDTLGGVRVVNFSVPDFTGAQRVTHTTFNIALEWETPVSGATTMLRSFTETVTATGGGPRYVYFETPTGPPIRQMGKRQTIYHATQTGRAVGYRRYPAFPAPIWPAPIYVECESEATKETPRWAGGTDYYDFPITWNYQFHSATPFTGEPTRWR